MTYYVVAKKYVPVDGGTMVADKRVEIGLSYDEAHALFKQWRFRSSQYWSVVQMTKEAE